MGDQEDLSPINEGPAQNVGGLTQVCFDLAIKLEELSDQNDRTECIKAHIQTYSENKIPMIDFESGLEWFNVNQPLSLKGDLEGRVSVLDFFTYCCINCLHVLPDLEALEQCHPPGNGHVLVIGVHSAKFENERVSSNIAAAVTRHHIQHPVVNDARARMWTALGISCWPTLLILGPSGNPLFVLLGEGHRERLQLYVNTAVDYYSGQELLTRTPVPLSPSSHVAATCSALLFPGKVTTHPNGIIVSDSGHNRVLLVDSQGNVMKVIGSGKRGYADGSFTAASFNNPQGVVYHHPDTIFIADTDNHAVRQVDILGETVTTVAGTGQQGTDLEGGNIGGAQAISSPWDLCLARSVDQPQDQAENLLLVAMAGCHQIWGIFLSDGQWLKGSSYKKGTVVRLAGSGAEENRNTSYPLRAGFAQPSGLTLSTYSGHPELFIADAESSTVRKVSLKDGAVKAVVGGARDPMDLFAFGDCDGSGVDAKLQHPLAVACVDQAVYVADSYNHKIKVVHPLGKTYTVTTVAGGASDTSESELNEPGGICASLDGSCLYIADTNNHVIKLLNLQNHTISLFELHLVDESDSPSQDLLNDNSEAAQVTITVPAREEGGETWVVLRLTLHLPDGATLNADAPNKWTVVTSGTNINISASHGRLQGETTEISLALQSNDNCDLESKVIVCCTLYVCLTSGVCVSTTTKHCVIFRNSESQVSDEKEIYVDVKVEPHIPNLSCISNE